jgi:cell division protein FtsW
VSVIQLAKARMARRARPTVVTRSAVLVVAPTIVLLMLGLVMILSSSSASALDRYGSAFFFLKRQVLWAAVGIAVAVFVSRVDYHHWRKAGWAMLVVAIGGLLLVLHPAIGVRVSGSSRWIGFGSFRFQPSELAKLALLLTAADVITRKQGHLGTLRELVLPLGIIAVGVMGLVVVQPDLGTSLVLGMIMFVLLFAGSVPLRLLGGIGAAGAMSVFALAMSAGYRKERLLGFLDPFGDRLNSGYQAVQSMIALGSGGLAGVGLGASRQKWMYVPNAHTDFIFAIIGEEMGLVGTLAVVGVFVLLAYAGIRVARRAADSFGRLVATGVTAWIVGQAIINMGAVTGMLPITGVPLPLVSFGGSALVFTLAGIGILANIAQQEVWPPARATAAPVAEPARRSARR